MWLGNRPVVRQSIPQGLMVAVRTEGIGWDDPPPTSPTHPTHTLAEQETKRPPSWGQSSESSAWAFLAAHVRPFKWMKQ